jgi:RimJ/RimL family protein N-acetyltransferase
MTTLILNKHDVSHYYNDFMKHYGKLSKDDLYNRFMFTTSLYAIKDWLSTIGMCKNNHLFFIEKDENNDFVGILQTTVINSNTIEMSLSVNIKKQGIGSALIQRAIDLFSKSEIEKIIFQCETSNIASRTLFEKMGFESKYNEYEMCITGELLLKEYEYA